MPPLAVFSCLSAPPCPPDKEDPRRVDMASDEYLSFSGTPPSSMSRIFDRFSARAIAEIWEKRVLSDGYTVFDATLPSLRNLDAYVEECEIDRVSADVWENRSFSDSCSTLDASLPSLRVQETPADECNLSQASNCVIADILENRSMSDCYSVFDASLPSLRVQEEPTGVARIARISGRIIADMLENHSLSDYPVFEVNTPFRVQEVPTEECKIGRKRRAFRALLHRHVLSKLLCGI